jgi:hypothetical protein
MERTTNMNDKVFNASGGIMMKATETGMDVWIYKRHRMWRSGPGNGEIHFDYLAYSFFLFTKVVKDPTIPDIKTGSMVQNRWNDYVLNDWTSLDWSGIFASIGPDEFTVIVDETRRLLNLPYAQQNEWEIDIMDNPGTSLCPQHVGYMMFDWLRIGRLAAQKKFPANGVWPDAIEDGICNLQKWCNAALAWTRGNGTGLSRPIEHRSRLVQDLDAAMLKTPSEGSPASLAKWLF